MKYLFISAHPDDLEFSCANLIRYLTNQRHDVEILCLTKGEFGYYDAEWVGPRLAKIRVNELYKAAFKNGVKQNKIFLADFIDGFVKFRKEHIEIIKNWLNKLQPDIIFAPEPYFAYYWQHDHINSGKLLYYIYKWGQQDLIHQIKSLYFYASLKPNFYWPFNDIERGKTSLYEHKSQWWFLKWMILFYSIEKLNFYHKKIGNWNYVEPYRRVLLRDKSKNGGFLLKGILGLISSLPFFNPTAKRYYVSKGNSSFAFKVRKLRDIYYPIE